MDLERAINGASAAHKPQPMKSIRLHASTQGFLHVNINFELDSSRFTCRSQNKMSITTMDGDIMYIFVSIQYMN